MIWGGAIDPDIIQSIHTESVEADGFLLAATAAGNATIVGVASGANLTNLTIPSKVIKLSLESGVLKQYEYTITAIGANAFKGNTSITGTLKIEAAANIGANAFENCTGITNLTLSSSVTSIGNYAFQGCAGIAVVTVNKKATSSFNGITAGTLIFGATSGKPYTNSNFKIKVPDSTSAGLYAANGNSTSGWYPYAGKIEQPAPPVDPPVNPPSGGNNGVFIYSNSGKGDGLKILGLVNPENHSELEIPAEINGVPVIEIGVEAFFGNTYLQAVVIPDTVIYIGGWAFAECTNLRTVVIERPATRKSPFDGTEAGMYIFGPNDSELNLKIYLPDVGKDLYRGGETGFGHFEYGWWQYGYYIV